ncbi:hypothetical protein [Roseicitreum antarcticum]|uniref:hypothetical protein n=1 Tax=Roseicitreum antarcticum TaxID=564137 RepID=UPI00168147A6|nr:hypothetical protein [Roseicitreum antarcticum]
MFTAAAPGLVSKARQFRVTPPAGAALGIVTPNVVAVIWPITPLIVLFHAAQSAATGAPGKECVTVANVAPSTIVTVPDRTWPKSSMFPTNPTERASISKRAFVPAQGRELSRMHP